jgi:hypothetical protein
MNMRLAGGEKLRGRGVIPFEFEEFEVGDATFLVDGYFVYTETKWEDGYPTDYEVSVAIDFVEEWMDDDNMRRLDDAEAIAWAKEHADSLWERHDDEIESAAEDAAERAMESRYVRR